VALTWHPPITEEEDFQKAYRDMAAKMGLSLDPDDPKHFYNYRALYKDTGSLTPDLSGHFPSKYKKEGHPRTIVNGVNTITGEPVKEKKLTWTPPKPITKDEEVVKATWQPPEAKPIPKPLVMPTEQEQAQVTLDELKRIDFTKYDEPTWAEAMLYANKAGFADIQSMALGLGKLLSTGGVQAGDKVSDVFDKDRLDHTKDPLRKWISDMVVKSETIAEDSWDKAVSKNRLKNFVALGGRAVPLTALTLIAGAMLVGAFPAAVASLGFAAVQMLPFALTSLGGHANRIEKEFNKRGEEAPYLALLAGATLGAAAEVATEVIPFQRFLKTFGGSKTINRGAKSILKKYMPLMANYGMSLITETAQEVVMVPLEKGINNLLFDENENLFPKEEMIQAGTGGLAMALIMGGLGSTNSAVRTFAESKVDKMLKHDLSIREGTLDIAEKVADETVEGPMVTVEKKREYLPEEKPAIPKAKEKVPKAKVSPQEQFVKKNVHKVTPKFPKSEYAVTGIESLVKLGNGIADAVGIKDLIIWHLGKTNRQAFSGYHKLEGMRNNCINMQIVINF